MDFIQDKTMDAIHGIQNSQDSTVGYPVIMGVPGDNNRMTKTTKYKGGTSKTDTLNINVNSYNNQ
ncbi:MAG TPA: hypothetical protein VIU12_18065, partial [Chryseolinea sp.]